MSARHPRPRRPCVLVGWRHCQHRSRLLLDSRPSELRVLGSRRQWRKRCRPLLCRHLAEGHALGGRRRWRVRRRALLDRRATVRQRLGGWQQLRREKQRKPRRTFSVLSFFSSKIEVVADSADALVLLGCRARTFSFCTAAVGKVLLQLSSAQSRARRYGPQAYGGSRFSHPQERSHVRISLSKDPVAVDDTKGHPRLTGVASDQRNPLRSENVSERQTHTGPGSSV